MLGMLLQRFEFIDYADYQLETKQTLTIKPDEFQHPGQAAARRRTSTAPVPATHGDAGAGTLARAPMAAPQRCRRQARHAAAGAVRLQPRHRRGPRPRHRRGCDRPRLRRHGRRRSTTTSATLPKDGRPDRRAASYNGQPPDNAAGFCHWLRPTLAADAFAGVAYSVFGCGNRDWAATYQAVPTLIDAELEKHGAKRMYPARRGRRARRFRWRVPRLVRPAVGGRGHGARSAGEIAAPAPTGPRLSVTLINRQAANPIIVSYSAVAMTVRANRELQHRECERPSERSTRHLEIALPGGRRPTRRATISASCRATASTDPARPGAVQARRRPVPDDHAEQRTPAPTCRSTSRCRCSACSPTASSCRTSRRAGAARHARRVHRGRRSSGRAARARRGRRGSPGALPRAGASCRASRSSTCSTSFRPARCRSRSSWTCCRRCGRATTPSRRRRWSSRTLQHHRGRASEAPARGGAGVFTGVSSGYLAVLPRRRPSTASSASRRIPFRPPENPHLPMIMVGPGRAWRRSAASSRSARHSEHRAFRWRGPCCSSAAAIRYGTSSTRTSCGLSRRQGLDAAGEPSPASPASRDLRAAGDAGARRRGVATAAAGGGGLRLRRRVEMAPGVREASSRGSSRTARRRPTADAQAWLTGLRAAVASSRTSGEADAVPVLGAVADEPPGRAEGGRRHPAAAVAWT